jgi:hypothetical protein
MDFSRFVRRYRMARDTADMSDEAVLERLEPDRR